MTNVVNREPQINSTLSLLPLAVVTTDDNTGVTGTALDMSAIPDNKPMLAVLQTGTVGNLDAAFVKLEESHDNITFTRLAQFNKISGSDQLMVIPIKRTKRYLRAVLSVEFAQPDEESPVNTTLPIAAYLVL